MRRTILWFFVAASAIRVADAATQGFIRSVKLDRPSLNVAAHETLTLTVDFAKSGTASVLVVDRDGYAVRWLANAQPVAGGPVSFGWDGRDDNGQLVADEVYSFKIDWSGATGSDRYFPADVTQPMIAIASSSYDRRTATLSYRLPQPSRVHIQAGTSILDPKTKQQVGPVMKTIANREPRIGGSIAEHWTGYDESGAIFIPDLENFVVAIAATPLPENSVITFGNRGKRFVETLSTRRGASLLTPHTQHEHHTGLRTQDDVSPGLKIEPLNATWSAKDRRWLIQRSKGTLRLQLAVEGPTAAAFRTHPATVELFVDDRRIAGPTPKNGDVVAIPLDELGGAHRISVNWNSDWGPVAANTIQVSVGGMQAIAGGGAR